MTRCMLYKIKSLHSIMALKTVKDLIEEKYKIDDHYDSGRMIWQYCIVDKKTGEEKSQIQLAFSEESTVALYTTSNHWFTPSETTTADAISVRSLTSNQKGLGSLMLAYGVLEMKHKYPKIKYSVLDDASNFSTSIKHNIYSKFGYSPVEAVKKATRKNKNGRNVEISNIVEIKGPEKQVLLTDFVKRVESMFPRSRSRSSRSAARSSSRSARSSSRRRANNAS